MYEAEAQVEALIERLVRELRRRKTKIAFSWSKVGTAMIAYHHQAGRQ